MINKTSLAALLGAVVGALAVSGAVWVAVQQKYLMTRDLTRDDPFVVRSDRYYDIWAEMAAAWDGTCDIEFDAEGEAVFANADRDLGVVVNGVVVDQWVAVRGAALLGDRYAFKCSLIYESFSPRPSDRYGRLLHAAHFGLDIPDIVLKEAEAETEAETDRAEAYYTRLNVNSVFDAAARVYAHRASEEVTQNSPAKSDVDLSGERFLEAVNAEIMRLETVRRRR